MQVHRLEDYRIRNRQGRSRGTGGYYVNRMGTRKKQWCTRCIMRPMPENFLRSNGLKS